jgi:hypothetical protein
VAAITATQHNIVCSSAVDSNQDIIYRCQCIQQRDTTKQLLSSTLYKRKASQSASMFVIHQKILQVLSMTTLLVLLLQLQKASGFLPTTRLSTFLPATTPTRSPSLFENQQPSQTGVPSRQSNPRFASPNSNVDGTGRGVILQGLVLLGIVWMFSLPTEFRRAHFCTIERCVENRSQCNDCVTFSEWKQGVADYYRNGGGIEFDFTVGEETKQTWKDAVTQKE